MKHRQHKMWTKSEFAVVLKLWNTHSTEEIAIKLGRNKSAVTSIAKILRDAGCDIPKKHRTGYLKNLALEFAKEQK